MAYIARQRAASSTKFIHSNIFFVAVPLGLCALAVAIDWLAHLA